MILDNLLLFTGTSNGGSGVPVLGANTDRPTTGTQVSTNVIDLHMAGLPVLANLQGARDIGIGDDPALKILAVVITTFGAGTSIALSLQGAPDNGSGAPGAFVSWWSSPVYTTAQLVGGARLFDMDMPRPPAAVQVPRFLQFQYVSVGTFTSGALEIALVLDRHDQMYNSTLNNVLGGYPPGITIAN
jgi:hypothetical protein